MALNEKKENAIVRHFTETLYVKFGKELKKYTNKPITISANKPDDLEKGLILLHNDYITEMKKEYSALKNYKRLAIITLATALSDAKMSVAYKASDHVNIDIPVNGYFETILPFRCRINNRYDLLSTYSDHTVQLKAELRHTEQELNQSESSNKHLLIQKSLSIFIENIKSHINNREDANNTVSYTSLATPINSITNSQSNKKDYDEGDIEHFLELVKLFGEAFPHDNIEAIRGKAIEYMPNNEIMIGEINLSEILNRCYESIEEVFNKSEILLQHLKDGIAAELNKLNVKVYLKENGDSTIITTDDFAKRAINELTTEANVDPLPFVGKPIDHNRLYDFFREFRKEESIEEWIENCNTIIYFLKNESTIDNLELFSKDLANWYEKNLVKFNENKLNKEQIEKFSNLIEISNAKQLNEKHRKVESNQANTTTVNFDNFTLDFEGGSSDIDYWIKTPSKHGRPDDEQGEGKIHKQPRTS